MTSILSNIITKSNSIKLLEDKLVTLSISYPNIVQVRHSRNKINIPKLRHPTWFVRKTRSEADQSLTPENREFLKEVVKDTYFVNQPESKEIVSSVDWNPKIQRTGLIARKIGIYPLWFKNGKKMSTTLLQVLDNHVIKYYTPETYEPIRQPLKKIVNRKGCLLIGAESADPSDFTREYCGLFRDSGVIPKRSLGKFFISPEAILPPGTLLNAMHFRVGDYVDVRGKTIDRGFQGVMVRHGFKGMPASHGVTKTHRRPGNIGGGGEKGRVWPGTKMPGHMGNRYRILKGLRIWRINTKFNVLFVSGQNIPGATNSIVYIYDTKLPLRQPKDKLPLPTYIGSMDDLPENIYDESVHQFDESSISFEEQ